VPDEDHRTPDENERPNIISRKSSTASVTFRAPKDPSLPQGRQRRTDAGRLRASSPTPSRSVLSFSHPFFSVSSLFLFITVGMGRHQAVARHRPQLSTRSSHGRVWRGTVTRESQLG
jgi:hypothetical protein